MGDFDFQPGGMIDAAAYKTDEISGLKVTPIFFIIDVSQSMSGRKIGIVNTTMEEIVSELHTFNSADSEIRFAVLSFGTNCTWETGEEGLIPCDGSWSDLQTEGLTYFNTACRELKSKLSGTRGFFKFAAGRTITPPVLILMTDGYANDGNALPDGKSDTGDAGIQELMGNKYFRGSYRIAIAIGENANRRLCERFTGDKELVYSTHNAVALQKILNLVVKGSVTVSSSGVSRLTSPEVPLDEVAPVTDAFKELVKNEIEADEELTQKYNVNVAVDDWD